MANVSIAGASGYVGQETLDRVLAHPALELYALGSDSLAGQTPATLDPRLGRNGWSRMPRFITNAAALHPGADGTVLVLPHPRAPAPGRRTKGLAPHAAVHHERGGTARRRRRHVPLPLPRGGRRARSAGA